MVRLYEYDVVVAGMGARVVRALREQRLRAPVVVLSSSFMSTEQRIEVLRQGADEVISPPLTLAELIIKSETLVSRVRNQWGVRESVTLGPFEIWPRDGRVAIDGRPVRMTGKERELLTFLVQKGGALASKDAIISHMYQAHEEEPNIKIVDVFICKLRNKLRQAGLSADVIETVWGQGYRIRT